MIGIYADLKAEILKYPSIAYADLMLVLKQIYKEEEDNSRAMHELEHFRQDLNAMLKDGAE